LNIKDIPVSKVYEDCRDRLGFALTAGEIGLSRPVMHSDLGIPGLLLAGFDSGTKPGHVQVIGEPEVTYLKSLGGEDLDSSLARLLALEMPCLVLAGGVPPPAALPEACAAAQTPLITSPLSASEVIQYLKQYLLVELAPETVLNGTLVDVHGVGILLRGKSGIGKSECALDLVERGHRLVADDLVRAIATPPGVLVGRSSRPLQNYVEVRGLGLIDIGSIYGIRALRRQKRIEIEVNLEEWRKGVAYDRSGLDRGQTDILGVRIPSIVVPLVPGKSVSVIVEVIAQSHILQVYGFDASAALNTRWIENLQEKAGTDFEPRDME
jgi:HPr kinase/phosphorylase